MHLIVKAIDRQPSTVTHYLLPHTIRQPKSEPGSKHAPNERL